MIQFFYIAFCFKLKQSRKYLRDGEERFREALMILDYRFFLIPLMFAMLRMWTCIAFILEVCVHVKDVPIAATIILRYLSVKIKKKCSQIMFVCVAAFNFRFVCIAMCTCEY